MTNSLLQMRQPEYQLRNSLVILKKYKKQGSSLNPATDPVGFRAGLNVPAPGNNHVESPKWTDLKSQQQTLSIAQVHAQNSQPPQTHIEGYANQDLELKPQATQEPHKEQVWRPNSQQNPPSQAKELDPIEQFNLKLQNTLNQQQANYEQEKKPEAEGSKQQSSNPNPEA
mmetsp:Transcript_5111/g.8701  ORF Transcript_5111/g.8701 Transcript_5111/m.8701 type:complete len:170 (+) Transcript_5111:786-1295(+)